MPDFLQPIPRFALHEGRYQAFPDFDLSCGRLWRGDISQDLTLRTAKLRRLAEGVCAANPQYMEALATVLWHELGQIAGGHKPPNRQARGGLAPWQLGFATEYVEEHLGDYVSLITLAGLVLLSPHRFCRAFKQSLGSSPCRYHGMRRVEQAKRLLGDPKIGVSEVARPSGHGETSIFTTAFRRGTGVTRTAVRRSFL